MSKSNSKKTNQLGMPIGTASNRLRKSILWSCVQRLSEDICFQCGEKITSVDELSIEHKKPWLDSEDPVDTFFDISNIAFSHISCNIGAARKHKAECGTESAYQRGCRCDRCKSCAAESSRKRYCPSKRRERYLRLEK